MSNLIVAIIGAALFSVILVYGADSMGPKIEEGRVAAAAAQLESELGLVASAVNRLRFARDINSGALLGDFDTYVSAGYLDREPVNPVDPARSAMLLNAAGQTVADLVAAGGDAATFTPRYVAISLGQDQLMCTWFSRYVGSFATQASIVTTSQQTFAIGMFGKPANCFRSSSVAGDIVATEYVAFVRI